MPLVRGRDTYSELEFAIETTYATPATTGFLRIPLVGEVIVPKRDFFPKSRELGNVGATSAAETGRGFVEGSFTVYPRYNAPWFNRLLCQAMGGSEVTSPQKFPEGGNVLGSGAFATHLYAPQSYRATAAGSRSGLGPGITFRAWKAGQNQGAGASPNVETFAGAQIRRMTWEHPEGDRPRVTFDIVAQISTLSTIGSLVMSPTLPGEIAVKARDLNNRSGAPLAHANGLVQFYYGGTWSAVNVDAFKFIFENSIDFGPAFINNPDALPKPGHIAGSSVTLTIESKIETTAVPFDPSTTILSTLSFLAGSAGPQIRFRARYTSDLVNDIVPNTVPYALDLYAPNVIITKLDGPVNSAGGNKITVEMDDVARLIDTSEVALINFGTDKIYKAGVVQTLTENTSNYTASGDGGNQAVSDTGELEGMGYGGTDSIAFIPGREYTTQFPGETYSADAGSISLGWINVSDVGTDDGNYAATQLAGATFTVSEFTDMVAIIDPVFTEIFGIMVGIKAKTDITLGNGALRLKVALSWNGGTNWTDEMIIVLNSTYELHIVGNGAFTWGHTWAHGNFDAANFRVRVTSDIVGTAIGTPEWRVDFLTVGVTWSPEI